MYTLNTIIKIQEDFAQAHQQINDFVFDQAYSYETKPELKYPLLWIDLEGSDLSETKDSAVWSDSYVFNVSVIDKVRENKEDEQEALNDCKLILNDYLIYLRQAEFPERLSIETTVSMKPLRMQGTDFVSGWQCQVKIQFVTDPDFCGIPLDSSSSSSPVVYTPYNYRVYFEDILGDALDNSNLAAYLNSKVNNTTTITINGVAYDLSANRTWTVTGAVTSVNGYTGVVSLSKSDVGLSNVDNTSDLNKPVSTATQTALNAKEDSVNKSTSTSDSASSTKFPVWSAILSYFDVSRIKTILGQANTSTDGYLSSTDWNTFNNKVSYVVPMLNQNNNTASTDQALTAGYSVVISRKYKINSGIKVTLNSGSRFRIL